MSNLSDHLAAGVPARAWADGLLIASTLLSAIIAFDMVTASVLIAGSSLVWLAPISADRRMFLLIASGFSATALRASGSASAY